MSKLSLIYGFYIDRFKIHIKQDPIDQFSCYEDNAYYSTGI